jgi:hypothetical protein
MSNHAGDILTRVCETYANLRSYRDVGESLTEFWNDDCTRVTHRSLLAIATRYHRPDRFFFEFCDRGPAQYDNAKHVVWMQGPRVRTWWSDKWDDVDEDRDIATAIARATGISSGTACWIARLLGLEQCGSAEITRAIDAVILGTETIEEVPCWHIEYADSRHPPYRYQIWIEEESGLIRRMFEPIGEQTPPLTPEQIRRRTDEFEERMSQLGPEDPLREAYQSMIENWRQNKPLVQTSQTIWWRPEANPVLTDADFEFDPSREK